MGHRERLEGGDEYDALTRARKVYGFRSGRVKRIKRQFWKRIRGLARKVLGRQMLVTCPECDGDGRATDEDTGEFTNDDCPVCNGEGTVER